jgi:hypothetical protein
MRKLIILKHGGGELANQLWNYLSICAYGLEANLPVRNPSFFEYHYFFRFLKDESFITKLVTRLFFRVPRRRSSFITRNERFKYAQRAWLTARFNSSCVYSSENNDNKATYLPPSGSLPQRFERCDKIYFTGWLFRNPKGLSKFGDQLREMFMPTNAVLNTVDSIILPLHQKYQKIIGIHIRQADYKEFKGGKFAISQKRARQIVDEYMAKKSIDAASTVFLIASDGPIDSAVWTGLNIYISKENSVTDLFLLSKTTAILGSDSSFGAFAAWYGNIPHIIFKNEAMDFDNNRSAILQL